MKDIPYDAGDKEVLESIIWVRVQQFLAGHGDSESIDLCPESPLPGVVSGESSFSDGHRLLH
jgi:hypothetical protein